MNLAKQSTWWILLGAFTFIAILVYGHVLGYGFVRWDDGLLIYENPAIRGVSLANLKTIFTTYDPELYIPLTLLTYQLDYMIAGANASWYHAINLLLHVCNAVLVTVMATKLTKHSRIGLFTGLLFLVHPLHTEAVVWASARKDLLSTFFLLLSITFFLQLRSSNAKKWYVLSVAAFTLGLLSKVTILTLPVLLPLIVWFTGGTVTKRTLLRMLPFAALSGLFAIIAFNGKTAVLESTSLTETIVMAGKSTVFYLEKLILPLKLSVLHPYNHQILLSSPDFLYPWIFLIALGIAALLALKKSKAPLFAFLLFTVTLSPSLFNFAKAGTYYIASDRYGYIPSIWFLLLIAIGLHAMCNRFQKEGVFVGVTAALGVTLAVLTSLQSNVWADSEALFSNVLKYYPDSYVAYNNLGNVYRRQGEIGAATDSYTKALAVDTPLQGMTDSKDAKILSNLGSSLRAQGKLEEALATYTKALKLDPENPQVHLGLGITNQQLGRFNVAERAFFEAIRLQPNLSIAYLNLGALYSAMGDTDGAIAQFEIAIEKNPYFPQAYYNLGNALRKVERNREARDAYEYAVELQPDFIAARVNLGIIYADRQEFDRAIEQFQEVLQYDPQNARALSALNQLGSLQK